MGREIQVRSFCDYCEQEGVSTDGTEYTIAIDKMQPRLLVACDVHKKEIDDLKAFIEGLQKADPPVGPGRPNAAQTKVGNRVYCQMPDCDKDYKNAASLRRHIDRDHGITLVEYREQTGHATEGRAARQAPPTDSGAEELPLDDDDYEIPEQFKCGVDGCDVAYDPREYTKPAQAVGMHRRRAHGIAADGSKVDAA